MHPFLRGLRAPLHIAHRGGALRYPENTLYAFERAVTLHRTDMLELDVHATRDGVVVVSHDATLDRCTDGAGRIADATWDEVRGLDAAFRFTPDGGGDATPLRGAGLGVPRFEDVLAAFPGLRLNVEVKSDDALGPFVDVLRRTDAQARVCLGSERDALAAALVEALPDACHFFPTNALAAFVLSARAGEAPEDDARYAVLDMPWAWEGQVVFDARVAEAARRLGKWVNVWTLNEAGPMRQAIADGVGGVMTDAPDVLRAVIDAWRAAQGTSPSTHDR